MYYYAPSLKYQDLFGWYALAEFFDIDYEDAVRLFPPCVQVDIKKMRSGPAARDIVVAQLKDFLQRNK